MYAKQKFNGQLRTGHVAKLAGRLPSIYEALDSTAGTT